MTGNPSGMVECEPSPADRSGILFGDMRPSRIECFGKLPLTMWCAKNDIDVKLLGVAYVPGLRSNLFSLHAVKPNCSVTLGADGAYMLGGSMTFVRRATWSYVEATVGSLMIRSLPSYWSRKKLSAWISNDLHVSLAVSRAETLRETARQLGMKVVGDLVPCAGCSGAKIGGWKFRGLPITARPNPCSACSWTCRGRGPGVLLAQNT